MLIGWEGLQLLFWPAPLPHTLHGSLVIKMPCTFKHIHCTRHKAQYRSHSKVDLNVHEPSNLNQVLHCRPCRPVPEPFPSFLTGCTPNSRREEPSELELIVFPLPPRPPPAGCTPWWLHPQLDPALGVAHGVTPAQLHAGFQAAQAAGRKVAAALLVSPTYFGAALPIDELACVCHAHGVPLIVDEAHGGHFGLHPQFPPSALQQGADASIQSTHKVLSAMTQGAMLHIRGTRVDGGRVARALQTLQVPVGFYLCCRDADTLALCSLKGCELLCRRFLHAVASLHAVGSMVSLSPDVAPASCSRIHRFTNHHILSTILINSHAQSLHYSHVHRRPPPPTSCYPRWMLQEP